MTQYFSLDRIYAACERLGTFDSKWVLVPLMMACHSVSTGGNFVKLKGKPDPFYRKFFDPKFIGLSNIKGWRNGHNVRPAFKDLRRSLGPDEAQDVLSHGGGQIWANNYT